MRTKTFKNGFTLVELAIVLTITALLIGSYFAVYDRSTKKNSERITEERLDVIEKAILSYYNKNGVLPCPAPINSTGAAIGAATDCSAGAVSGVTDFGQTRQGGVPIQELNLSPQYFIDGWNNRIGYTVIRDLSTTVNTFNNYSTVGTDITIIDDSGATYNQGETAAFVIWSYGNKGEGATTLSGATPLSCTVNQDGENCDNDSTFRDQFKDFTNGSTSYYDDILKWKSLTQVKIQGDYYGTGGGFKQKYGLWSDQRTGTSNQPASSGWTALTFPTQLFNSTAGVTVIGSTITLPEGEYILQSHVVACGLGSFFTIHYNNSTGNADGHGSLEYASNLGSGSCRTSVAKSRLSIPFGGLTYTVWGNGSIANGVDGYGRSVNGFDTYSYRFLEVWEITN